MGSFLPKKKDFMFPLSDLFYKTQQKLKKSFECGTYGNRFLTRGISAIAIILNEKKSINALKEFVL